MSNKNFLKKSVPLVASCTILCDLCSESDKLSPTRYRDIDSKRKTLTERFFRLKTDGFQNEICPEWKRDKQKLETWF